MVEGKVEEKVRREGEEREGEERWKEDRSSGKRQSIYVQPEGQSKKLGWRLAKQRVQ